jgi:uncharacterized YccA/Bax inhibitor family protein
MKSSNPALGENVWSRVERGVAIGDAMTVQGAANKAIALLALVVIGAAWTWYAVLREPGTASAWMWGGMIGGLILALATTFKPTWSPVTAPLYAGFEGLALGAISAIMNYAYPGIVIQAVALTFGTCFAMLAAYTTGLIKATDKFKAGVVAATGGICLVYLISIVLGFFGVRFPYIHDSGIIGIGFSLVVVVIAAMNLVLDFDLIESAAARGLPRYMEWYCAFGLIVTLVWLYLEFLNLLRKLRD